MIFQYGLKLVPIQCKINRIRSHILENILLLLFTSQINCPNVSSLPRTNQSSFITLNQIKCIKIKLVRRLIYYPINGCRIYEDIMTAGNLCRHIRLLINPSDIGQYVRPILGEGVG